MTPTKKQLAVEKLDQWRKEGLDYAGALENAAVAGWRGLVQPKAVNRSVSTPHTHKYAGAAAAIWNEYSNTGRTIDV